MDKSWKHTVELQQFTYTITLTTHTVSFNSYEQILKFVNPIKNPAIDDG